MPTHAEERFLPYSPERLFALVADVERYPEFLPWCAAARIRRREGQVITADLVIGFKIFRENFTSEVTLDGPDRIDVKYENGPFKYLNNHWIFKPAEGGCVIDFYVDFEFHSRLFQIAIGAVFNEAVRRMVDAFEIRAEALFGAPKSAAAPDRPEMVRQP